MTKFSRRSTDMLLAGCQTGIEDFAVHVRNCSNQRQASIAPEHLVGNTPRLVISRYFQFLYTQNLSKYAELCEGLVQAVNQQSYLVFAACGRGLIELTALLRYYTRKLQPHIEEASKSGVVSPKCQRAMIGILDQQARGARFDWLEFHFGDRMDFAKNLIERRKNRGVPAANRPSKATPDQVNIQTALDQWSRENTGVILAYDYFCELVHPNLGSNFLVMGASEGELTVGGTNNKSIAESLCAEGIKLLAPTAIRDGSQYLAIYCLLASDDEDEKASRSDTWES